MKDLIAELDCHGLISLSGVPLPVYYSTRPWQFQFQLLGGWRHIWDFHIELRCPYVPHVYPQLRQWAGVVQFHCMGNHG